MKIDPHNSKERYLAWKEKTNNGIERISKINSDLLLRYLNDMEIGINVFRGAKKGPRGFMHLNSLKERIISMMKRIDNLYGLNDITKVSEEQILLLFADMRNGKIVKPNGKKYMCVRDYVKVFKAFWHWWQRINNKKGIQIPDITIDLDTREEKPDWVYLTEEQIKKLADNAKYEYKVLIWFLFDTGIRAPTEVMNIRVSDLYNDFKELNIREEVVKIGSFGRRIKLLLSGQLIKEYVRVKNLKNNDLLFDISFSSTNQYLKRLAKRILGEEKSQAGQRYSELTLYDFRHNACCYWLPRYKSESALKYRFGWKENDKIHYYSELLGMRDTISEEDILIDITKTEIEKQIEQERKEKEVLKERMQTMELQMAKIMELTNRLGLAVANGE